MRVASQDKYVDVGEFDPGTGSLEVFQRDPASPYERPDGHFGQLAGVLVVFYRLGDDLYLRIGDLTFLLDDKVTVTWRQMEGKLAEFSVRAGDHEFVTSYESGPPDGPPLEEDPTPHISLEDWDFGLFVVNVLNNPDRRALMYRPDL